MTAPNTREELVRAIRDISAYGRPTMDCWYVLADAIMEWRAEWRHDAEPRLRPVSEMPDEGDRVAVLYLKDGWRLWGPWHDGTVFPKSVQGWALLPRAKRSALAEEARELLAEDPGDRGSGLWMARAAALLRRFADQEKRDEC